MEIPAYCIGYQAWERMSTNDSDEFFVFSDNRIFMSYLSLFRLSFPAHDDTPVQCPMFCLRVLSYSSDEINGVQQPNFVYKISTKKLENGL